MSARTGVLCAGSVVADVAKVIDAYPALDHLATIEQVSTGTGGPGLNMAVDLRLLGATFGVGMLGAVGDDLHGDVILAECAKLDIDTTSVARIPGAVTSFTDVMVERDGGRRTFFHHHGANAIFDGATADLGQSQARILHAGVDSLIINELEARRADRPGRPGPHRGRAGGLGDPGEDGPAPDRPRRLDAGRRALPRRLRRRRPGGRTWRQGYVRLSRAQIRSTTGAGDAFAAGVVLGPHEGWPVDRCLRLGAASAAACVSSPHTSNGIPTADVCLTAADRAGYRRTDP